VLPVEINACEQADCESIDRHHHDTRVSANNQGRGIRVGFHEKVGPRATSANGYASRQRQPHISGVQQNEFMGNRRIS